MEKMKTMRIRFLGALGCVTGSSTLIEFDTGEKVMRYLIDLGTTLNGPDKTSDREIQKLAPTLDGIFITHAHADHIGRLPVALNHGFTGMIYLTKATTEISSIMLKDQLKIMKYDFQNIERLLKSFTDKLYIIDRESNFQFSKSYQPLVPDLQFTALRSSHILGSCSFVFRWVEGEYESECKNEDKQWTYLYLTGDLGPVSRGSKPGCLFKNVQFPFSGGADKFIVMESTYGGRLREKQYMQHENRLKRLEEIVNDAIDTESVILIPAFSLDRAQQIQIDLHYLIESGRIKNLPPFSHNYRVVNERTLKDETLNFLFMIVQKEEKDLFDVIELLSKDTDRRNSTPYRGRIIRTRINNPRGFSYTGPDYSDHEQEPVTYTLEKMKWHKFLNLWDEHMEDEFVIDHLNLKYNDLSEEFQAALWELDNKYPLQGDKKPKSIPVKIHSPLIGLINQVYRDYSADSFSFKGEIKTKYIADDFLSLFTLEKDDKQILQKLREIFVDYKKSHKNSFEIRPRGLPTSIILTSSGMLDNGMVLSVLDSILTDDKAIILLSGFQSPDTNGFHLKNMHSYSKDKLYNTQVEIGNGKNVRLLDVKCRIEDMGGYYSGHADHEQLVAYATYPPEQTNRTVFLLHGDDTARQALKSSIEETLSQPNKVIMPNDPKQWYRLETGGNAQIDSLEEPEAPSSATLPSKMLSMASNGISVTREGDDLQVNLSLRITKKDISEILSLIAGFVDKDGE